MVLIIILIIIIIYHGMLQKVWAAVLAKMYGKEMFISTNMSLYWQKLKRQC